MRTSRIQERISVDAATGCHNWTGAKDSNGYGHAQVQKQWVAAHRWFYARAKGEIPGGLVIDHLCRNPACCNPDHLEAVTQRENIARGFSPTSSNAAKVHCLHGHPFTEANTYRRPDGTRDCRACVRERARRYKKGLSA